MLDFGLWGGCLRIPPAVWRGVCRRRTDTRTRSIERLLTLLSVSSLHGEEASSQRLFGRRDVELKATKEAGELSVNVSEHEKDLLGPPNRSE